MDSISSDTGVIETLGGAIDGVSVLFNRNYDEVTEMLYRGISEGWEYAEASNFDGKIKLTFNKDQATYEDFTFAVEVFLNGVSCMVLVQRVILPTP